MFKKNTFQFLLQGISGKAVSMIISLLILIHVIAVMLYIDYMKGIHQAYHRTKIVQQVLNVVHLANVTPYAQQQQAVDAIITPNIHITLAAKPTAKLKFDSNLTNNDINTQIPTELKKPAVSVKLHNGRWLNFNIRTQPRYSLFITFLLLLEVIVACAILFSAWSINRFTKPLQQFRDAAERLGVDLKTKPIVEYGPPVVRATANAMNNMQARIQELIQDRTQMLASISHDLRTPITRLKLRAQFMQDEEQQLKTLNDLNEMERMIEQTLVFARTDMDQEQRITLDLASIVASICDDMQEMHYQVDYKGPLKGTLLVAKPLSLKRAITNLIENAVKYGEHVWVKLKQTKRFIIITIDDDGPGIPEKDLEKVLTPYYRSTERSPSNETSTSIGLGLAIAKEVIRSHGGKLELSNRKPLGLRVSVTLKRSSAQSNVKT